MKRETHKRGPSGPPFVRSVLRRRTHHGASLVAWVMRVRLDRLHAHPDRRLALQEGQHNLLGRLNARARLAAVIPELVDIDELRRNNLDDTTWGSNVPLDH